ncbi:MAG: hypothetical protein ACREGH_01380 [Minisyncoccia bacterium]
MFIVKRSGHNPIVAPSGNRPWEAKGAFNGCPAVKGKEVHLLYRALGNSDSFTTPSGISTIGSAMSRDGYYFPSRRQLIVPEEKWEHYGLEDPRVTFFEGQYVIFYTALGGYPFNHDNIKVACALSKDLEKISERHLVTPFNAKAMALFPERVGGKVTAILTAHTDEPPARIAIVQANNLEDFWDEKFWEVWHEKLPDHVIDPRRSNNDHVEVGAQPIQTKDGWLVIYSYIQNYFGGGERVFGIEALLLDLKDPRKIVGRTEGPFLVPQEIYERYGAVPNIVFPSGALLQKNGRLDIYYGAADTVCAKASLYLPDLLDAMIPSRRQEIAARAKENPIIAPLPEHPWENKATFNAAAVDIDGTVHILYRAMSDKNISTFGYAASKNGVRLTARFPEPVYVPREEFEMEHGGEGMNAGCEDPRLTRIGNTLYLAYTAFNGRDPWHATLSSIAVKDFKAKRFDKWATPVVVTPSDIKDKDFCVLPGKVGGEYMLIHRLDASGEICADFFPKLDFKTQINRCIEIMGPRPGMWDSARIGIAGPPIKTSAGWLMIYHGVSVHGVYRLGAALLDSKNPTVVLSRAIDPILEPVEKYEVEGQVPRVVFSCGAVARGDTLILYYGGGDSVTGVAKLSIKKLIKMLLPSALA